MYQNAYKAHNVFTFRNQRAVYASPFFFSPLTLARGLRVPFCGACAQLACLLPSLSNSHLVASREEYRFCVMARSAPDTSFDDRGSVGGKPGYQWYTKIEMSCQNLRAALVEKSSIRDSDKASPNMACGVKLVDSTACIERSQESTT